MAKDKRQSPFLHSTLRQTTLGICKPCRKQCNTPIDRELSSKQLRLQEIHATQKSVSHHICKELFSLFRTKKQRLAILCTQIQHPFETKDKPLRINKRKQSPCKLLAPWRQNIVGQTSKVEFLCRRNSPHIVRVRIAYRLNCCHVRHFFEIPSPFGHQRLLFEEDNPYHFSMDYCFRCRLHPFFTQSCPDVEPCNADKSHRIQKRHNQRAVCVGFYHAFMFANVAVRCQLSTLLPCSFRNSRLQAPFGQMDRQICEQALDFGGKNSLHNHVGTTFHPSDCRLPLRNIPFAVLNLQFVGSSLCGHYPFYHYMFGMLCRCAVHKHNDSLHSRL